MSAALAASRPRRSRGAYRVRRVLGRIGLALAVLVLISPALFVFLWMLSLSLKNEVDNTAYPPVFIPHPPTLANFADVFAKNDFLSYTLQLAHRLVQRDRSSRCWSACPRATASPNRARARRRR